MDEYISRGYAVENMENYPWDTEHDRNAAIHLVRELVPAADVRPVVRGKWIDVRPINQSTFERIAIKGAYNKCSLCGRLCFFEENFCPNCGADMREVDTDG